MVEPLDLSGSQIGGVFAVRRGLSKRTQDDRDVLRTQTIAKIKNIQQPTPRKKQYTIKPEILEKINAQVQREKNGQAATTSTSAPVAVESTHVPANGTESLEQGEIYGLNSRVIKEPFTKKTLPEKLQYNGQELAIRNSPGKVVGVRIAAKNVKFAAYALYTSSVPDASTQGVTIVLNMGLYNFLINRLWDELFNPLKDRYNDPNSDISRLLDKAKDEAKKSGVKEGDIVVVFYSPSTGKMGFLKGGQKVAPGLKFEETNCKRLIVAEKTNANNRTNACEAIFTFLKTSLAYRTVGK